MRPFLLPVSLALGLAAVACTADEPVISSQAASIIGGVATSSYPAVPLLYSEFADGTGSLCSGTLISPRVVLTAAHCVEFDVAPTSYVAYFGADVTVENEPAHLATIGIADYTFHPEWDIDDLEGGHDIGLVLLDSPGPVPPMAFNRSPIDARIGEEVHLVGWGKTTGDGEDYGKKREVMSTLQAVDPLLMQYGSAIANTCQGDSGGPNFMSANGVETVTGITSFGNVGCDEYGVGTRVDSFAADFIDPYIAANDPTGSCAADGACAEGCGATDPDCADDGSGGDGDGAESGVGDPPEVTGGCSAGGGPGSGSALLLALIALTVVAGRRSVG